MEIAEGCRCTYPEGLTVTTSHYFHTGMTTLGSFYHAATFFLSFFFFLFFFLFFFFFRAFCLVGL